MYEIFQILFWTRKSVLRDCEYVIFPKVKQMKKKLIKIIITKHSQGAYVFTHPRLIFWKFEQVAFEVG